MRKLTPSEELERERLILRALSRGLTIQEIGSELGFTPVYVSRKLSVIRDRYGCRTNEQLMFKIGRTIGAVTAPKKADSNYASSRRTALAIARRLGI